MPDEIKSALEIALEKAEKIGKASKEELEVFKLKEEAQRLVAKFLRNEISDFEERIKEFLKDKNPQQKKIIYQGMVDVFLRNVVLPSYEYQLEDIKKTLEGLRNLFKNIPEISKICQQLEKLLKEYYTHKEAIYNELVKRFNTGVEALEKALSDQLGTEVKVSVEEHPQFKEEWNKIKSKLDEEYGKQLEYFKNIFKKIVS
ncbi:MAG: hypothetical protein OD816_001277 [Thermodesulfobacterium sp.]|uniref:Uncharacterized protein n=1 Tax=Candidatus Thermodesulfobacterium syntrophicum TaxID=3060442 RepID=A0AAE3P2M8_9BACT|nr:hypothetical protein [Candidatus Thermodesulfobacterium syntrophicum]